MDVWLYSARNKEHANRIKLLGLELVKLVICKSISTCGWFHYVEHKDNSDCTILDVGEQKRRDFQERGRGFNFSSVCSSCSFGTSGEDN